MGLEEAFHSGELQGAEKHELERMHVQLPSPSLLSTPSCSSGSSCHRASSSSLCHSGGFPRRGPGLVLDHGAAASSGTTREGPCEGGCPGPRGRPGLSHTPARTPPNSEEPLRGAGGWENSLLAVDEEL